MRTAAIAFVALLAAPLAAHAQAHQPAPAVHPGKARDTGRPTARAAPRPHHHRAEPVEHTMNDAPENPTMGWRVDVNVSSD